MRNTKRKTALIIGILATIMVFGAVVAFAQNSSEKKKNIENHEMMDGGKSHSGMMGDQKPEGENNGTANHCGDKDSDMGSMMGSGNGANMKSMM